MAGYAHYALRWTVRLWSVLYRFTQRCKRKVVEINQQWAFAGAWNDDSVFIVMATVTYITKDRTVAADQEERRKLVSDLRQNIASPLNKWVIRFGKIESAGDYSIMTIIEHFFHPLFTCLEVSGFDCLRSLLFIFMFHYGFDPIFNAAGTLTLLTELSLLQWVKFNKSRVTAL